jgi:hypothetical protein
MILNAGPDLNIAGAYGLGAVIEPNAGYGVWQCEQKPYGLVLESLSQNGVGSTVTKA